MAGRKRLPTALHIINGNPSKLDLKDRLAKEPKPQKTAPECPDHLDGVARKEWNRMAPILERLGLLTEIDGAAFAAYCQLYSRWVRIEKNLYKKKLTVDDKQHPLLVASRQTLQLMRSYCTEFGLTPSARGRMITPGEEEDDDFGNILDK